MVPFDDLDIRSQNVFIKLFYNSVKKGETEWIESISDKIGVDVLNSSNIHLKSSYGVVCAFNGDFSSSFDFFDSVINPSKEVVESKGLLAFELGNYNVAKNIFENMDYRSKFGAVAYSLSLIKTNNLDVHKHLTILYDFLPNNLSNRILGTLAFNDDDYFFARENFKDSWMLDKSRINLLNILSAERKLDVDYAGDMFSKTVNKYFSEAKCIIPSTEIIDEYMFQNSLKLPDFSLGDNLTKVLFKINQTSFRNYVNNL